MNKKKVKKNKTVIPEEVKKLVIERLSFMDRNRTIYIGDDDSRHKYTRDELIKHVLNGDTIGKTIVDMEMSFLKALADGSLLNMVIDDE